MSEILLNNGDPNESFALNTCYITQNKPLASSKYDNSLIAFLFLLMKIVG